MKVKGKPYLVIAMIFFVMAFSLIALAAAGSMSAQPSWWEHVDLMEILIGALFTIVLWFMIRTLRKIDRNQNVLFERLDKLCEAFYELRGEHKAMKERCSKGS